MYQISNQDYEDILEYLSAFARVAYLDANSKSGNIRLLNQGRRASVLVGKLIRNKAKNKKQ